MDKEIKTYDSFDDLFNDPNFHFPFQIMTKQVRVINPVREDKPIQMAFPLTYSNRS